VCGNVTRVSATRDPLRTRLVKTDREWVTNGVAFGLGVGLGFALSLARLVLWASPLRPRGQAGRMATFVAGLLIPVIVAFAMPTFKTALLVLLGDGVGLAIATPVVLPLAHVLLRRQDSNSPSSE
jgi:hypothetical protein